MGITNDPTDPRLSHGIDRVPVAQAPVYLVLSEEERARGYVEPVRRTYIHLKCGAETTMAYAIAETYARNPRFYGATYCVHCQMHRPLDEFVWDTTPPRSMVPVERYMADGPCWCYSETEPHTGWIHAPRCVELRAHSKRVV
jgi:hypothetical protein